MRIVPNHRCRGRFVCDSDWRIVDVGQTCLCSCGRIVGAELFSGDERRFCFRVLSLSGLRCSEGASRPKDLCCRLPPETGRSLPLGGSMEFLRRGRNSQLTQQITYTHFKKRHSTLFTTCSNVQTNPRACGGAIFCGNMAPGHDAIGKQKAAPQRPSQRSLSHQIIVAA